MGQQAKSPAEKSTEFNEEVRMKLAVTYTTSDGKEFYSEPQIITKVKGGENQESPRSKRHRDAEAYKLAFEHETNLALRRDETPVIARKMSKEEFAEHIAKLKEAKNEPKKV
jgi:hypothetical protein